MSDLKLPYVQWRGGRPRFHPSARELKLGFKGEDLKDDAGNWLTLDQTKTWAEQKLAEIKAARLAGKKRKVPATRRGGSVGDLLDDWLAALKADADPDTKLSADSIRSYDKAADAIRWKPETRTARKTRLQKERAAILLEQEPPERRAEEFAGKDVLAIGKIELNAFYLYAKGARGHHMALSMVAAFSAAWSWGELDPRWRLPDNPRHSLRLPRPAGRIVIYADFELRALDAAAAALGRPSIGDSVFLGVFTAQRQRDRLYLKDEGLVDGRRHFRQSKTGTLVAIKETPQLAARLNAAHARAGRLRLKFGTRPDTIVVDEHTGQAYVQDTYRHVYAEVRALAIAGSNEFGLAPCPSLADHEGKKDLDLRDTAVTWLARSGSTLLEICAISGHSAQSVQTIIRHYLGAYAELADAGIDKLVAWMAREGIAV